MTIGTIERARGRWREILPRLGVDSRFLVNKHGPCPLCGGRDRFRYDDRDGSGSYYCGQCGAGAGIILLRKLHGWDFATAAREVDKIIGTEPPAAPAEAPPAGSPADRLAKIERALAEATDPGIVSGYLAGRGLTITPDVLRGHRGLWHAEAGRRLPAVIAPIIGPDGRLQSAQRIYVGNINPRKKTLTPVETINGGAVRLFDAAGDTLGIAEGVETAVAAHELFSVPTWAALSTAGMETFEPPAGLCHAVIFADNDTNFAGQKAAYVLATRLVRTVPWVEVEVPPEPDTDWLDVLAERQAAT